MVKHRDGGSSIMTLIRECRNCDSFSAQYYFDCNKCHNEVCSNCVETHLEDCKIISKRKENLK